MSAVPDAWVMRGHCPGSWGTPASLVTRSTARPRGTCTACGREYALTNDGTVRLHHRKPQEGK